jgi:outer membrane protein OmpU
MKHILLATTALVATAGIASADVSIGGSAEIGVMDNGSGNMEYFQDIDVSFSMSGETDGGLSFSAGVDLDETPKSDSPFDPGHHGGATISLSGGFGSITMGDTDGASDWALTETGMGGSIADDETGHAGYSGNSELDGKEDGQILRWDYSLGAVGLAVSLEQANLPGSTTGETEGDDTVQVGLKYSMDMGGSTVGLGVGFADAGTQTMTINGTAETGDTDTVAVSLSMKTAGGITGVVNMTDGSKSGKDYSHIGLGIGMSMDALTVGVNYGEKETDSVTKTGVGLAVNYALGGGAVFKVGYGDGEGTDTMSVGLALSF